MNVEIKSRPANSYACITLQAGETVTAEAGAMIAMSGEMNISTQSYKNKDGGNSLFSGLKRMLAGESFFVNTYNSPGGGEIMLSTTLPGDMECLELDGTKGLVLQAGSFVAKEDSLNMDIRFDFKKNLFSGEQMIWSTISGKGKLIIGCFGALYAVDVDGEYVVDTGNIAAYENSLDFTVRTASKSLSASIFSGEGLVCKFKGKGRLYCQTHADRQFGSALKPLLKPRES